MSNILDEIIGETRRALPARMSERPPSDLKSMPLYAAERRGFALAVTGPPIRFIAEHKRRSPSRGVIRDDISLRDVVAQYEQGGASAISVLTEPTYFGGALADLSEARRTAGLPLLRKDFIVHPYQIVEARAFGADAILLIAAVLEGSELTELHAAATVEGLDVLVEVHEPQELERVNLDVINLIGVNNRDLRTFEVDMTASRRIFRLLPENTIRVSESGFASIADVATAAEFGADSILVGETLMRAGNPHELLATWVAEAVALVPDSRT